MKAKKLIMPLALIFFALFFGVKPAKAQTVYDEVILNIGINLDQLNGGFNDGNWEVNLHNDDTNTDYYFDATTNTGLWTAIQNTGQADLGNVPLGHYTITFTEWNPYDQFYDIEVNGYEDGHVTMYQGGSYTFIYQVDLDDVDFDECNIWIFKENT